MINIFKKSFLILKNNLIFIQPLLLCILLIMTAAGFIAGRNIYFAAQIILTISSVLLWIAFSAGWFFINKCGILNYDENDSQEDITVKAVQNFKKFFEGVGSDFFKTLFSYVILFLIYFAVIICVFKVCIAVFGEPKIFYELPKLAKASSQAEILTILNSFTFNDKIVLSFWIMTVNIVFSILNFFCLLYFAVNSFEKNNLFKSLWIALKFFFNNIISSFAVILFIFLLYILLNVLSVILGANSFSFIILIILLTIYLNYYVVLVFCFYNEKTKDNSNNRSEFIGEDSTCN